MYILSIISKLFFCSKLSSPQERNCSLKQTNAYLVLIGCVQTCMYISQCLKTHSRMCELSQPSTVNEAILKLDIWRVWIVLIIHNIKYLHNFAVSLHMCEQDFFVNSIIFCKQIQRIFKKTDYRIILYFKFSLNVC